MRITANSPEEYISKLPDDRKEAITKLREIINKNIPDGFEEQMNYGMIGWVIPHSLYPNGYHTDSKQPLPFMNIASQKNHIAVYHSGVYSDKELNNWFVNEFKEISKRKLDMGKSCIRFKNPEHITYDLIGELSSKLSAQEWINMYETSYRKKK